ncbi:glycosyltransferase family 9 protein [Mannheimia pernigra]|uniref:Glycosyltransferase family 9 protein n=1 Tax=Mannheimia pernigra TaxID=111844 RepID=A0A7D5IWT8_9PAST|nr:glycosyltransferase family 9 protein [Mannheimia pernigra]QLB41058.1 glycosyltransferase family 9 protein [Mannheimia pernigra]
MKIFKKLMLFLLEKRNILNDEILHTTEINSILIRPLGWAIGDAVVHTAHIKQLKKRYPNAKIGVVVASANKVIYENSQLVDSYVYRNFLDYIRNYKKWDLVIDFENNFNSSSLLMDRIINPKYIVIFRKYHKKYYNLETIQNYNFHYPQEASDKLSHYLLNSGFNANNRLSIEYSVLNTEPEYDLKASQIWREKTFRILLSPYGSKRYIPVRELAELLNQSVTDNIEYIDIILSNTELAQEYYQNLQQYCPHLNIRLSPKQSLSEYISLVASADFVIAVDGGALHIACAFQKPLLSFFAKSMPNMGAWEPLLLPTTPHFRVLTKNDVGTNSNLTEDFEIDQAIIWFKNYLIENIN